MAGATRLTSAPKGPKDDANREAYHESARAGLMVAGNSFAGGQDSVYHVTKLGFERKADSSWSSRSGDAHDEVQREPR
jgi:hypothetical protein